MTKQKKNDNLPDPLLGVISRSDWEKKRKSILNIYRHEVYGAVPDINPRTSSEELLKKSVPGGFAEERQIKITLTQGERSTSFTILLFLPVGEKREKYPLFLGLNFAGNHTVFPDPDIFISPCDDSPKQKPSPQDRGCYASRWPVVRILERGYALATVYAGNFDPDFPDGFKNGVHSLIEREKNQWGSISAWAWGLSRTLDYLETLGEIDQSRVAAIGHSRLGKTALWAAAQDQRFSLVIPNNSGCGGAALFRYEEGETIEDITTNFPHWFNEKFNSYRGKPYHLPLDQHFLLSLIAPRAVYVASARGDADSDGEYLSACLAGPVYELYGKNALPGLQNFDLSNPVIPDMNTPIHTDAMGYHLREGYHDITMWDWEQYMDFRDKNNL